MADGFVFYRSFGNALNKLPAENYKECMQALIAYAFDGTEPESDDPFVGMFFELVKPQLDANARRREAGGKGGQAKPKQIEANGKQTEAKPKQIEANGKQTEAKEKDKEKDKGKDKEKDKAKENEKAKGEEIKTFCSERSDDHSEPLADVEAIPLNDGSGWRPKQKDYEEFCRLYPGVDVKGEIAKMRAWSLSNPTKRKTKLGVLKFVNAWLSKTQDSGHRGRDKPSGYIDRIDHRLDVVDDWLREEGANDGSTVCDFS